MALNGNETEAEILALANADPPMRLVVSKATLHKLLDRYADKLLDRMELFNIAEMLEHSDQIEYDARFREAIAETICEMAWYPLKGQPVLEAHKVRQRLEGYQANVPVSGFEDLEMLRSSMNDPQEPTLGVSLDSTSIWLERYMDHDITREYLAELAQLALSYTKLRAYPDVKEILRAYADPARDPAKCSRSGPSNDGI